MSFSGRLYLTDSCACLAVEGNGRSIAFRLQHSLVATVQRVRPRGRGEQGGALGERVLLGIEGGRSLTLAGFDSGEAMETAFALLEHMSSANNV